MSQTGYAFVPPHNPGNYPPTTVTAEDQAPAIKRLQKNQALFRRCTAMDGALKTHIVTRVQSVLLYPMVDQLAGLRQVTTLDMNQHVFNSYKTIYKVNLEEKGVKMM